MWRVAFSGPKGLADLGACCVVCDGTSLPGETTHEIKEVGEKKCRLRFALLKKT
jgi:hypothetical protein